MWSLHDFRTIELILIFFIILLTNSLSTSIQNITEWEIYWSINVQFINDFIKLAKNGNKDFWKKRDKISQHFEMFEESVMAMTGILLLENTGLFDIS